ncbi:hypothetical protein NKH77_00620 [Streptomyces sp. M19]
MTQQLRAPESRKDDLAAIAAAVRARGARRRLLFAPARRRVWELPYASSYSGLVDLALEAGPHASHTLYGTELPPSVIRARMLASRRIVVLRDPARVRSTRARPSGSNWPRCARVSRCAATPTFMGAGSRSSRVPARVDRLSGRVGFSGRVGLLGLVGPQCACATRPCPPRWRRSPARRGRRGPGACPPRRCRPERAPRRRASRLA